MTIETPFNAYQTEDEKIKEICDSLIPGNLYEITAYSTTPEKTIIEEVTIIFNGVSWQEKGGEEIKVYECDDIYCKIPGEVLSKEWCFYECYASDVKLVDLGPKSENPEYFL